MRSFVIVSGCSGGGKSTLIDELARRGHPTVPEPGRRVVAEQEAMGGSALPWLDMEDFVRRTLALARLDLEQADHGAGWVFFDRGLIDAASALEAAAGVPAARTIGKARFYRRVFLAPPWPEIYVTDTERKHGLDAALAEYDRLSRLYPALDYETLILPKAGVEQRADFVLGALS